MRTGATGLEFFTATIMEKLPCSSNNLARGKGERAFGVPEARQPSKGYFHHSFLFIEAREYAHLLRPILRIKSPTEVE